MKPRAEMLDVLCVGFSCLDFAIPFHGLPRYDRKTEFESMLVDGGGPAATESVALHRLGCTVGLISVVGLDDWGRFAYQRLQAEGIPTEGIVQQEGKMTPLSIIMADPEGGARTILWNRGTLTPLSAKDVQKHWKPARMVLVDEVYPEASTEAMRLARLNGIPVLFDAGTAGPGLEELVRGVDYLIMAEHFPSRFTGIEDPGQAMRAMQQLNGKPVIVTMGSQGCMLDDGQTIQKCSAYAIDAVDSTGAGDAFHAAVAFGLLQGWSLARCLPFANFYAAQNCRVLGGRKGLLGRDSLRDWL